MDKNLYEKLGKKTEEMYWKLEYVQRKNYHSQLQHMMDVTKNSIMQVKKEYGEESSGKIIKEQLRQLTILEEDYINFTKDDEYKFRILVRGCGNAGKSTLINALLCLNDEQGSKMDKKPMTFTIDTFTDELSMDMAELKILDDTGRMVSRRTSRQQAAQVADHERADFEASKRKCQQLIQERTQQVYTQEEKADIEKEIYENHLLRTRIREVKWGVGENDFLKDCCIIDTPGLSQELRFTNIIDDVKSYEADGIIWVVSTKGLQKGNVREEYQREMQLFEDIYADKKAIAVVNVFDTPLEEYDIDSEEWRKFEKMGRKLFGKGFDDIICVNVRKAYEGMLEGNSQKLAESNIGELRSKINKCFIEKNSDEYIDRQLGKIKVFEKILQQMCDDNAASLRELVEKYDEITGKIKSTEAGSRNQFLSEKKKIKQQFTSIYHNNLNANAEFVQNMDNVSEQEWQDFLKTKVIVNNELQKRLAQLHEKTLQELAKEFDTLQKVCVVSEYCTSEYAFRNFRNKSGSYQLLATNLEDAVRSVSKATGSVDIGRIGDVLDGLLGKIVGKEFGVKQKINNFLTRISTTPMERAKKAVNAIVNDIGEGYSISQALQEYVGFCEKIRDDSMNELCDSREKAAKLYQELEKKEVVSEEQKIEQVTIQDILIGSAVNEI